ncbi:MAG TPA: elongation factor 4, partial [Acidobacteria bacterium]|nr:elongation factor 4 [Acidobacteriota bacterium]
MRPHERIRNFSIIAHIDHGKSTLADRILQLTHAVSDREMVDQVLDDMDLERERGITIKARAVRLFYKAKDGVTYQLNLIDTPGHVDFSYEVSRSLAACEGALLVVDASQGVEAQTLANAYLAIHNDLTIVPVLNKIDLPAADPERVREQIEAVVGIDAHDAVLTSAKAGIGIEDVLERVVRDIPPPQGDPDAPLKALLFDSWYDPYRGVVCMIRVVEGTLRAGDKVLFMSSKRAYPVDELGIFTPKPGPVEQLSVGEAGFFYAGIKDLILAQIGDTVTLADRPTATPYPGFQEIKPMVFAGLYPVSADDYEGLRDAVDKLRLNDASFTFEPESSGALGFGFRCGFLGLLHMEIIQARLEREFNLDLITTAPGVRYLAHTTDGKVTEIESPSKLPDPGRLDHLEEPYITSTIITRAEYVGGILALAEERRGTQKGLQFLTTDRVLIEYDFPLAEVVSDFYDRLKSISRGYASFDYQLGDYRRSELVKLDVLVNGDPVDALSLIVHRDKAYQRGKNLVEKMKELIPRQLFEVVLQAAIGS